MDETTRLRRIRAARDELDAARAHLDQEVSAAIAEGIRPSAIGHEARWSDTYVRSLKRKVAGDEPG